MHAAGDCHPLVRATEVALRRRRPNRYGLLKSDIEGTMEVRVGEALLDRALSILQTIIVRAQTRGWSATPRRSNDGWHGYERAGITVGTEVVAFVLAEGSKLINLKERRKRFGSDDYRYEPTGLLRLQITSSLQDASRLSWSDGRRQQLEDMVEPFLDAVAIAAEESRVRREAFEARQQREKEEEEREELETERNEELQKQITGWRWASSVRDMIAEVRRRSLNHPDDIWRSEAVRRWVEWSESAAKKADPFENGYFNQALSDESEE